MYAGGFIFEGFKAIIITYLITTTHHFINIINLIKLYYLKIEKFKEYHIMV